MELAKFSIPTFRQGDIQKRLEKLARKAEKYGNPDITIIFGETRMVTVKSEYGQREYEFIDVTVSGEAPKINGWQLQARIELMDGENLIHCVPGANGKLSTHFRTHTGHCDHCNTDRRRNDIYVLTDGTDQIAVGRSCLRDFLGIDDPKAIVNRAQFFEELRDIQEDDMISFGSFGYYDMYEILTVAAGFIRTKGYVSKTKQQETGYETTGEAVTYSIRGVPGYKLTPTEDDRAWAKKTVEFFRNAAPFGNDYMDNIRVLMKQDIVMPKHVALITSSVITAQRQLAPKPVEKQSDFVGEEKQRLKSLELTVDKIIFLGHGAFGASYLHLMKDVNGNVFSWITGNKLEVSEGSTVKLDASVKQHKLYNGVKQTVLTRARQLEEINQ